MNWRTSTIYWVTGMLFCITAAVTAFGKAGDIGMAVVWLALAVTFFGLGTTEARKQR